MKKTILVILAALGLALAANAQPKALGIRIGSGVDISYQNYLGGSDFLEFELGLDGYASDFHIDGVYNFMIAEPDWTSSGKWGFYGGPGVGVGVWNVEQQANVFAGVLGNLGLEYTFDFPLQLSLDIRPRLFFGNGGIWSDGIFSFGLGVRYAF